MRALSVRGNNQIIRNCTFKDGNIGVDGLGNGNPKNYLTNLVFRNVATPLKLNPTSDFIVINDAPPLEIGRAHV